MAKMPWFKLNANDWLADSRLQRVGLAEQGLLMRLLCLMHQSETRGVLETEGIPWTVEDIAKSVGERSKNVKKMMENLVLRGVLQVSESGAFFSRRMIRDTEQHQRQSQFGKQGGNPTLKGGLKAGDNPTLKPEERREKEEGRSKSNTPYKSPKGDAASAEKIYQAYPRKVAKGNAIKAIRKALQSVKFEELLSKVQEFARCVSGPGVDESFIPHPATWFNAQRWTDDPADWQRIGRNRAGPPGKPNTAPGPSQGIMDWAVSHGVTDGKN